MTTRLPTKPNPEPESRPSRRPYAKPEIRRIDLALEETLSTGCKSFEDCELLGNPSEGS